MSIHTPLDYQQTNDDLRALANGQFRVVNDDEPNFQSTYNSPEVFRGGFFSEKESQVKWIWPDKIPWGRLTLIEGPPAVGKLFVALDIAARVSTGTLQVPDRINRTPATPEQIAAMEAAYSRRAQLASNQAQESKSVALDPPASQPAVAPRGATGGVAASDTRGATGGDQFSSNRCPSPARPSSLDGIFTDEIRKLYKDERPGKLYVRSPDKQLPPRKPNTGVVVICDYWDAKDMIIPRLKTMGADIERISVFTEVNCSDRSTLKKYSRSVQLPLDTVMFDHLMRKYEGSRTFVINNLEDYCETPKQMDRAIKELDGIATYLGIAIIATVQNNVRVAKDGALVDRARPADRAARCVWSITADPVRTGLLRMEPKRMTFCKKPEGIAFRITDAGKLNWEPLPEYQRPPTEAAKRRALEHARMLTWLTGMLGAGVVLAEIIYDAGREAGFSKNKLIAARNELGARTFKIGFGKTGSWLWTLKPEGTVGAREIEMACGSSQDAGGGMKDEIRTGEERREKGEGGVAASAEKTGEKTGVLSESGWQGRDDQPAKAGAVGPAKPKQHGGWRDS